MRDRRKQAPSAVPVLLSGLAALALVAVTVPARADAITQGFEGVAGTNFTLSAGATTVTSPVHSGSQAIELSVTNTGDDAEVDTNVSAAGLTLGQILSANYWVYSDFLNQATQPLVPYLYFKTQTPHGNAYVVMWNPGDTGTHPAQNTWTNITIDPATTLFHVAADTTGLTTAQANNTTLASLSALDYEAGTTWGDLPVLAADIELGQEGNSNVSYQYEVDDLTINRVPEPASLSLFGVGLIGLLGFTSLRRRKPA